MEKRTQKRHADQKKDINGKLLKSKDAEFSHIALTSSHVVVYVFGDGEWHRASAEGPLYMYRRKAVPTTMLLLMNRKSPRDIFIPIDEKIYGHEAHPSFLVLEKQAPSLPGGPSTCIEVYGFWFYNPEDARLAEGLLLEARALQTKSKNLKKLLCL